MQQPNTMRAQASSDQEMVMIYYCNLGLSYIYKCSSGIIKNTVRKSNESACLIPLNAYTLNTIELTQTDQNPSLQSLDFMTQFVMTRKGNHSVTNNQILTKC